MYINRNGKNRKRVYNGRNNAFFPADGGRNGNQKKHTDIYGKYCNGIHGIRNQKPVFLPVRRSDIGGKSGNGFV